MFFIQACQGDQLDGGVHLKKVANTETDSNAMSYKVDFCYTYIILISKHNQIVSTVSLKDRKSIFRFHHMQIFLLYIQQFLGFIPGEIPLPVSNVMKVRHISNTWSMIYTSFN